MSDGFYSASELREFDRLTDRCSSHDQMTRISARLDLEKFIKKHGKEKCDVMWQEILRKEHKRR